MKHCSGFASQFMEDLHNDVVDGDVDEFDEESDEAHDGEPDRGGHGDLLKFYHREKKKNDYCDHQMLGEAETRRRAAPCCLASSGCSAAQMLQVLKL